MKQFKWQSTTEVNSPPSGPQVSLPDISAEEGARQFIAGIEGAGQRSEFHPRANLLIGIFERRHQEETSRLL